MPKPIKFGRFFANDPDLEPATLDRMGDPAFSAAADRLSDEDRQ
jgi:hypothetical protein